MEVQDLAKKFMELINELETKKIQIEEKIKNIKIL